jgi:hypothetical protein
MQGDCAEVAPESGRPSLGLFMCNGEREAFILWLLVCTKHSGACIGSLISPLTSRQSRTSADRPVKAEDVRIDRTQALNVRPIRMAVQHLQ